MSVSLPISHTPTPGCEPTLQPRVALRSPMPSGLLLPAVVAIPAGLAEIGSNHGFPDEAPAHIVAVPTFAIGIHPVTNHDYVAFLADTGMPSPCYWHDARLNQADQPIVGVTWGNAVAYSCWLTRHLRIAGLLARGQIVRLPTEIEWEKAASWDAVRLRARRYPWGDTWDATRAVTAATGTEFPVPVADHPGGMSAFGAHNMLGNVWEWTASIYASYPGAVTPFAQPNHYVIRGGSCTLQPTHLRCSFRCRLPSYAWRYHLGFRIVVAASL